MTDVELLKAVIEELKKMKLKFPGKDGLEKIEIYAQNKPFRFDEEFEGDYEEAEDYEAQKKLDNYVIVSLENEKTDKDGRWTVEVRMTFQIMSFDDRKDGEILLANLMNEIDFYFTRKGILKGKYEMEKEKEKAFNPVCPPNYAQSAFVTRWKIPNILIEMEVGNLI